MRPIEIVAIGSVGALGMGVEALVPEPEGQPAQSALRLDPQLQAWGLSKPASARALQEDLAPGRAQKLLRLVAEQLTQQLQRAGVEIQNERVGLLLGTSSGDMLSQQELLRDPSHSESSIARSSTYYALGDGLREALGLERVERCLVLGACASSTVTLGLACRWLELGHVDVAIAGGCDALSHFVSAGFESLGITSASAHPFSAERDGMVLGEGACLFVLRRSQSSASKHGFILGFGASSDAHHITAPEPEAGGLGKALDAALRDAGISKNAIDLVSAHGTATVHNDAAEAAMLRRHFNDVRGVAYKAALGHTLGASGALETAAALQALESGVHPATAGLLRPMPELGLRLAARSEPHLGTYAVKLSAGFGGLNAALVCGLERPAEQATRDVRRRVYLQHTLAPVLQASRTVPRGVNFPSVRWSRLDELSRLVVGAAARLLDRISTPEQTAVVLGSQCACLESNRAFFQPVIEGGPPAAPPRLFPSTSPNLAAAQCSIGLGLRGPAFGVGWGRQTPAEALAVAHDLIACGDVQEALVIVADLPGSVARAALGARQEPVPPEGAMVALLGSTPRGSELARPALVDGEPGHLGLRKLLMAHL